MKTVLVTSAVTFVPHNYDDFVISMAASPQISGLIIIDNRSWKILLQALVLIMSAAAPRLGLQLLKNHFGSSMKERQKAYRHAHKQVWIIKNLNDDSSLNTLKEIQPDLILNARTRTFFRKNLLNIPKMGCLNIHHGLLPDQRGLMCDFWAHYFNTPAGFSIHKMTTKLDDGSILKVTEVPSDKTNYLLSLKEGAQIEAQVAKELLETLEKQGAIPEEENKATKTTIYRKNPGLLDFYRLRIRGIKI